MGGASFHFTAAEKLGRLVRSLPISDILKGSMSKRKASVIDDKVAEPADPPKRATRGRAEQVDETPATARKKRGVPAEPEPTPVTTAKKTRRRESVEPPTPTADAPKKKLGRPKKLVEVKEEEEDEPVAPAPLKTPAKTGRRPKAVPTTPSAITPAQASRLPDTPRSLPKPTTPFLDNRLPHVVAPTLPAASEPQKPTDEGDAASDELTAIWVQCLGALHTCWLTIGPIFLLSIGLCYVLGKVSASRAVSAVGVVYTLLLTLILGTYTLSLLPFVSLARLLARGPQGPAGEFRVRLTVYLALLALAGVCVVAARKR